MEEGEGVGCGGAAGEVAAGTHSGSARFSRAPACFSLFVSGSGADIAGCRLPAAGCAGPSQPEHRIDLTISRVVIYSVTRRCEPRCQSYVMLEKNILKLKFKYQYSL